MAKTCLALTTAEGDLPAAIETQRRRARRIPRDNRKKVTAYRESSTIHWCFVPIAIRGAKSITTIRFSSMAYWRLRAFDPSAPTTACGSVMALVRVPPGGDARVGEEEFYADLTVDFVASTTVLIPSVALASHRSGNTRRVSP